MSMTVSWLFLEAWFVTQVGLKVVKVVGLALDGREECGFVRGGLKEDPILPLERFELDYF